ncbi:uncharacterized protein LOC117321995 [Pecten maximus]|uniref:uncharacterized protein LOC117321995 n=1 Tax=Pecten maximus TaxID=6579 RepID=UPI00145800A4|nr:uncharacterized protein LOC117321995 [Pecten maximus]XP_033732568.1 uncharacterized protein LOC117321995 [Pecten maximus]XP_033732569.1 uncharacterized protein LOC117321995 [Pecten maximus]XP_033732570.1 uncharacterized protein LOC117321995 [Pecten maximus]XP_033732571.1 uncharacterized protein LOC117321995 [Pecten maximus]XP_033732573.1 uncharacterized protein LOC117321995 [Pecten maximus]
MVGQRGNRGGGRGGSWGMETDMGAVGGSMLGGYNSQMQDDTGLYGQGGKKRTYNESQDGYSVPNYYENSSTDPYYRGLDPPSSRFVKTETTQQPDQYASYYENWDSGYYNQGNNSQSGGYSDYNASQQQSSGGYNQSSDFSQDIDFPSKSNFSKVYNKNQQTWSKRGGGGRGGRGQQQQQSWGRGQGMRGGRGNNRGNQGGMMGKRGQQKPGFPPQKAFTGPMRGNKRGRGGRGGNAMVPPIHSLAKVSVPDVSKMSIAEKIRRFCLYLQAETNKVNSIQTIENALTGSKLGLKTEYEVEELMRVAGRWMYTGYLKLDGIFLTRSVGANKKEVKHDVYTKGLELLKTKTVAEVFALKDPGVEAIRSELTNSLEVKKEGLGKTESLQVAKQAMEEMTNTFSTKHDGFDKLMTYLRQSSNLPESQISCIEQGISASHCGLTHSFDGQMVRLPTGKLFFRGTLTIAEVVIAVGTGYKKKDAKVQTYERALEALRTKTMVQILKSVPEAETGTGVVQEKVPPVPEKDRSSQTLLEKMTEITQLIKEAQFRENNINYLDVTAIHLGFTPTCIYRKLEAEGNKTMISCELYLDSILISTGEAERRKEAQVETYNNAWDVLCTTAPDYILKEHKRLKPGEQDDPSVMDVWVKGSGKPNANTNMPGLKRNKMDPNEAWKTVEVIVLMEHEDWSFDRQRQAFCILNYSSTLNGMLLQWQTEHDGNMFKSTINLQHKNIGEASALGKNTSRNLAAACALFKLYETQDVIRISRRDDTKLWVEYSEIKKKAEALRVANGAPKEEEVDTPVTTVTQGEGEEKPSVPANKWVIQVAEQMITQHIAKQTLEELIFGPGMPFSESKEVRQIARNMDLKHDIRQLEGQSFLIIHKRTTPQEMVKVLRANNSQSGKYSLVDKTTLPTYQELLPEIEKHEAMRNTGNTEGTNKKKIKKDNVPVTDEQLN